MTMKKVVLATLLGGGLSLFSYGGGGDHTVLDGWVEIPHELLFDKAGFNPEDSGVEILSVNSFQRYSLEGPRQFTVIFKDQEDGEMSRCQFFVNSLDGYVVDNVSLIDRCGPFFYGNYLPSGF